MVERFNGCISELFNQTSFAWAQELGTTLEHCLKTFNRHIPQRALHHQSPVQAFKDWQRKKPDFFVTRVYEQSRLDTCLKSIKTLPEFFDISRRDEYSNGRCAA